MNEYLLRHAIRNVWCNPAMDKQHVYRTVRLTPNYGTHTAYNIDLQRYLLPTAKDYYHLYQIGKVEPSLLGIPKRYGVWMSLKDLINETATLFELYINSGIQIPKHEGHLLLTASKNLIIAVKINPRVHNLEQQELYLRFYSNAYFDSARSNVQDRREIFVMAETPTTTNELVNLQLRMSQELAARGGVAYYFVNGRFTNTLTLVNSMPGDAMEMVLDDSVDYYLDFDLGNMPSFLSELDEVNKFLIHYDDPSVQSIRYFDDLEVFLYKPVSADRFLGVTFHRNEGNWLRQLTHKDYSVSIPRLNSFIQIHEPDPRHVLEPARFGEDKWTKLSDLRLRIYFRQSGYDRPLQAEASRIHELYRLSSEQIVRAMTGIDSTVDIWKASNLEKAAYPQFMGAPPSLVNPIGFNDPEVSNAEKTRAQELAGQVYGYHAAATILAKTPSRVYTDGGSRIADLAYAHWYNATIYEFDAQGHLLGVHPHTAGRHYTVRSAECVMIEALVGKGGDKLNSRYGHNPVTLNPEHNFRVYVVRILGGVQQGDWIDVTDLDNRHEWGFLDETEDTPVWRWTYDPLKWYGCVRQDDYFLSYDLSLNKNDGLLRFSIGSIETHGGIQDYEVLEIPVGQLDIFVNGRALIENLDYVVNWPEIVICNAEYLSESAMQEFHIRGFGFCKDDFTRPEVSEFGFIEYGVLSNDATYHIHSHKVQRIVVDGHYRDPADLHFEEDWGDVTIDDERNGAPYCIKTPPVVFKDVYKFDKVARDEDDRRDQAVAAYMGRLFPKRQRDHIDTIVEQYHIVSVFANKVLHDLRSGRLKPTGIDDHYSDRHIKEILKPYEWLLAFDMCNREYNENHVEIWPHWFGSPVGLPLDQYNFYRRALAVYLRKTPDVSVFVYVDTGI